MDTHTHTIRQYFIKTENVQRKKKHYFDGQNKSLTSSVGNSCVYLTQAKYDECVFTATIYYCAVKE